MFPPYVTIALPSNNSLASAVYQEDEVAFLRQTLVMKDEEITVLKGEKKELSQQLRAALQNSKRKESQLQKSKDFIQKHGHKYVYNQKNFY